ncbi:scyllo-inosose 3-dehydrogenase [Mycolicibacterium helvum]|uniref:Alcohol dehydrogenase n=1 Tax=Mycolicibacterium helvum TaxID=1534349 RepID=A0A7I7T8E3_9MYCO|nr:scyllo-inosose 3-dehydrogenase [Mycolicibacterium helvum]BBY65542.1 alcohol dehydrogenase [Mycolicibacterium helvum]
MKAVVLEAEWSPRPGARISEADHARRWAAIANDAYRNPTVDVREVPDPGAPGPSELVLEVGACGLCGSDVHMFETDDEGYLLLPYHLKTPVITGHEFAGRIVAKGKDVHQFEVGGLVAVEEIQWCGKCRECRGGYWNQCGYIEDLGFTLDGGFAQYVKVDSRFAWSLDGVLERYGDEDTALEVGALTEPTSVAYEGMFTRAGGFKPGGSVVVFGGGPIGLASVALAAAAGAAQIFAIDPLPGRRELAGKMGATRVIDPSSEDPGDVVRTATKGDGAAMVVEASGNSKAVMGPIEDTLGVGGKVVIAGMDAQPATMNLIRYMLKAGSVYGTVGHSGSWNFPNVINLMAAGRINMENAITRRFPLAGLVEAIDETKARGNGKILVKPQL